MPRSHSSTGFVRRLHFEPLENRQLLATFTVSNLSDGPVSFPGAAPGTLRQAVYDANHTAGADVIEFDAGLSGTINLSIADDSSIGLSALIVSSAVTIQGNTKGITIGRNSAASEMRLFHVTTTGDLTLNSVSVTGGVIRGTNGASSSDPGGEGRGGGIYNEGALHVTASTLYGNEVIGGNGGSSAAGGSGRGGAIYSAGGSVIVTNATISGATAQSGTGATMLSSFGGAIYIKNGSLGVYNSTITNNTASTGRGIYIIAQNGSATADIWSSIIAQNDAPIQARDFLTAIDDGAQMTVTGGNNLIRTQGDYQFITVSMDDPLLGPLSNNGGPTMTHALLAGSPAVDIGSNPQSLAADQRGASYTRVVGGVADIGAFEMQSTVGPSISGDYNGNHVVDASDYVLWRATLGAPVAPSSGADGNGDGTVNAADYGVWRSDFGARGASGASTALADVVAGSTAEVKPIAKLETTSTISIHEKPPMRRRTSVTSRSINEQALLALMTKRDLQAWRMSHLTTSIEATDLSRCEASDGDLDVAIWEAWLPMTPRLG